MSFGLKILTAGRTVCGSSWGEGKTFRVPYCRFYFIENGSACIYLDKKKFNLEKGHIYFIPRNIPTKNHCPGSAGIAWIHFFAGDYELERLLDTIKTIHRWPLAALGFDESVLVKLSEWSPTNGLGEFCCIYAVMFRLFSKLYEICQDKLVSKDDAYMRIKAAIDFMDINYLNHPDLKTVAAMANMAPNYFHRKFKEVFPDSTPYSYMNDKVMSDALELLKAGRRIKEIAETLNYEDVFYFSRVFKKTFGYSPANFRTVDNP